MGNKIKCIKHRNEETKLSGIFPRVKPATNRAICKLFVLFLWWKNFHQNDTFVLMRHKYLNSVLKQTRSDSTFILPSRTETDTWFPTPQDFWKVTKVFANPLNDFY